MTGGARGRRMEMLGDPDRTRSNGASGKSTMNESAARGPGVPRGTMQPERRAEAGPAAFGVADAEQKAE